MREHDGHLGDNHDPHEVASEVGEGAFEGSIDRLDDLASSMEIRQAVVP